MNHDNHEGHHVEVYATQTVLEAALFSLQEYCCVTHITEYRNAETIRISQVESGLSLIVLADIESSASPIERML